MKKMKKAGKGKGGGGKKKAGSDDEMGDDGLKGMLDKLQVADSDEDEDEGDKPAAPVLSKTQLKKVGY